MKVKDYMPELYENNLEMNAIMDSDTEELETGLKLQIDKTFSNTFIKNADEKGISNYEKILEIKPNKVEESLEFRRERVINRLTTSIPFSERFFINRLNEILGKDQWEYTIDYNNYTLLIKTLAPGKDWYNELLDFFEKIVPCNIEWKLQLYAVTWQAIKENFATWQDVYNLDMTWQEVSNGVWL